MTRIALFLPLLLAGCGGGSGDPLPPRTPVSGSVTVAGQPAVGLTVRFHVDPATADPRASVEVPVLTDAEGKFTVSQNEPGDGLAPGQWVVTFFWPAGGDPDAPPSADQLRGRYLNPAKSKFRVTIGTSAQVLPPFELK